MENPDLPLTTAEYTEWGNPNHAADARRIGSYSPLDNLQEDAWPPVFLQGSWHDSRVPYWEPAKLYARLSLANIASPRPVEPGDTTEDGYGLRPWRRIRPLQGLARWGAAGCLHPLGIGAGRRRRLTRAHNRHPCALIGALIW